MNATTAEPIDAALADSILVFLGRCCNRANWFTAADIAAELGAPADQVEPVVNDMATGYRRPVQRSHDGAGKAFFQITLRGELALPAEGE